MRFTASGLPKVSREFRLWIVAFLQKFDLYQKDLTVKAGVTGPWLSQMLSGRRQIVDPTMMRKLRDAIATILETYGGGDKEQMEVELTNWFAPYDAFAGSFSSHPVIEPMHIAADLFAVLREWCPDEEERGQVIELLRAANELTKTKN